jgi:polyisoprenyl-teichoic acid--peptidoglycan teichoic acid transferase
MLRRGCVPGTNRGERGQATWLTRRWRRALSAAMVLLLALAVVPATAAAMLLENPNALQALSARVLPPQRGAQPWDGRSRLVVALFGLTQRTTEPARTDTILILTLDPQRHRASLLSVPRDLWVAIPGYGQGKLAIAYEVGGPRLAVYTLQRDLGIPVQYYVALTFRSFTHLVDALGGVTIDVPQELRDPQYPCLTTTAYCPIDIRAGIQHLDGATALEFVRERHAFAQQDLARVRDQQAFLVALRRQTLQARTLLRAPALLRLVRRELITDLPFNALPSLALAYARVPQARVTHAYIDLASGLVQSGWSADGQSILLPTTADGIPALVRRLTHDPVVAGPGAAVTVWNGSGLSGLAADVGAALQRDGHVVTAIGTTPHAGRTHTVVVQNTLVGGVNDAAIHVLARMLQAPILARPEYGAHTPIVILLGSDIPTAR